MRNYTARGELKVANTGTGSSGSGAQGAGALLAHGTITPLAGDDDGIAEDQAIFAAEDLDGIALAQAPSEDTPLVLETAAEELIPPRFLTITSLADLSAINFEIQGTYIGEAVDETLAGPAGAPQDDDGIAQSQSPIEDAPLVLEAVAAELDPPRQLTFTSSDNLSGISFEIVGLDAEGEPQTVAAFGGPNNETLTTSERWSVVTSITPDGSDAGSLEVGWPDTTATVISTNVYSTVESITPDDSSADQLEVGWPDSGSVFPLALAATSLDPPRRVTFSSSDDLSSVAFQIFGLDEHGDAAIESVQGPNMDTVSSSTRFSAVSSIVPQSLAAGSLSVGWGDEGYLLYRAPAAVEISHFYARNNDADALQTVDTTLIVEGEEVPWLMFDLDPDEVASVLLGQHTSLPLNEGNEIRVTINTPGAVSFTLHGRLMG